MALLILAGASPAAADFTDTAIDWDYFDGNPGYTIEYTYLGDMIADNESSPDSSHGGSGVSPSTVDIGSCATGGTPGDCASAIFGYYNGGTAYDPDDPSTMDDDYVFFRLRMVGDPVAKDAFGSRHYNILLDVDGDGYKEFWIDLEGDYTQASGYDRLNVLYDNANNQGIDDPDATGVRVEYYAAYNTSDPGASPAVNPTSHTRVVATGDGQYWVDIQVPVTAFDDSNGNQVLFPDSPVAFFYSTSTSNQDPLQKDHMMDGDFLSLADPITFGDVIIPNGQPILELTDADRNQVAYYSVGDDIHIWVTDRFANTDSEVQECITVTVSDPAIGDDEVVTLCETGTATGIFVSDQSGACVPEMTNPDPPPDPVTARITELTTSTSTVTEDWTVTYSSATSTWTVAGSVSGTQTATATAGTPYSSDGSEISFTVVEDSTPTNGTVLSFCTTAGDLLTSSTTGGSDDDGDLEVASGDEIVVSYTNSNSQTVNDSATMLGPCTVLIEFTRANGFTPEEGLGYELFDDPADSDKLYITVTWPDANDPLYGGLNPSSPDTLTDAVTLCRSDGGTPAACDTTNGDYETITLVETGNSTGVFRNTDGLETVVADPVDYPIDDYSDLWEGVDGEVVIATFDYECPVGTSASQTTSADLFYIEGGGRVVFSNGAGTQEVDVYSNGQPVFVKVTDENACSCTPNACTVSGGINTMTVTVTSDSGDSETITVWETASGSGVFMNRENDLATTSSSAVVTSASSTFVSDGLQTGDTFVIATGPDQGTYTISTVDSQTQLTLTESLGSTRTGIGFSPIPLMTATYDGSSTSNDDLLEADNADTLTVTYSDCLDGDSDSNNDSKTDTATYNAPSIVINAVLFYPDTSVSYCQTEYVELYNSTTGNVNVTGYELSDEDSFSFTIPQLSGSDITLLPGEKLIVSLDDRYSDYYDSGVYYLFTGSHTTPSDDFGDPDATGESDRADQISLYNSIGTILDYTAWSDTSTPSLDFKNDDTPALLQTMWLDDSFKSTAAISSGQAMERSSDGYDTDQPDDWVFASTGVCDAITTRAFIISFAAYREQGRVVVTWQTGIEDGTIGFDLQRRQEHSGRYTDVNQELLPALIGSPQGGTYRLVDAGADVNADQLTYRVVEVEARPGGDRQRMHGPYTVAVTWPEDEIGFDPNGSDFQPTPHPIPPGQLRRLEARGQEQDHQLNVRRGRAGNRAKIAVSQPGLYFVSAEAIAGPLALPLSSIKSRIRNHGLILSNGGTEVAWLAAEDKSGLYFYGSSVDSPYTDRNIYWLEKGRGLEMETDSGPGPSPSDGSESFVTTVHLEEQTFPAPAMVDDPEQDFWFWRFILAGSGRQIVPFTLEAVAADAREGTIVVSMRGSSDTGTANEHHAAVYLNGAWIGEGSFQGQEELVLTLPFDHQLLQSGGNSIELDGLLDSGAPYSVFFLDSIDLTYQRHYLTTADSLVFNDGGNQVVTVGDFTDDQLILLDISEPQRTIAVTATTISNVAGLFSLSFRPERNASYLVTTPSGLLQPDEVWANLASTLDSPSNAADYLLIAPGVLLEAAEQLAVLREDAGLRAVVVDLEDVFDQFNYGQASPWAIRSFLATAYQRWRTAPGYVVLVGGGSFDYRNYYGLGDNLVPSPLVATEHGLFPADNLLADLVDDDGVPEIAIGRLPLLTAQELTDLVDKIAAYESDSGGAWQQRVTLAADDNPWGQRNFREDSEAMAGLLSGHAEVEKIYIGEQSGTVARQLLHQALERGTAWLSFVGHAGLDRITDEGILLASDVALLGNQHFPVVSAFTCTLNRFDIPGFAALGGLLTGQADGGAVAVWGPSGLVDDTEVGELGYSFFAAMTNGGQQRLGDAVVQALADHAARGGSVEVRSLFILLGDPALQMQIHP
jgi:hypothetical protein